MNEPAPDIATTLFTLPPDAKFLPVAELSPRLRARIGVVEEGQAVVTRPGFRVTTRLLPGPLAELLREFHEPIRLTDAVLRFARAHDEDPFALLDLSFDALATLVEARILVPEGSADAIAPEPTLAAGQAFAGFEIEAMVRSLDDSEVYRAHAPDGGDAALKVARDDRPGIAAMLAGEAGTLDRLGGRDAPRLLAHGVEGGRAFVAMEWCDGVSIAVAAQQARAARDRVRLRDLVGAMLEAYARLHARGVLHGDVHPGNCLVRDDGRVVILDFGHARPADAAPGVDIARAGIPQFHDPQMAEALLAGRLPPPPAPASEQYALCVLSYLLLTGLPPIESPAVHDELLRRIVGRPPLPFAARGVASWPDMEAALARGLAKSPADRFPDVAGLARAVRSAGVASVAGPALPRAARRAFDAAIAGVRDLAPSANLVSQAWFALRAALALDDAELLAVADLLVRRAGSGWEAQAVAAHVARAQSDARTERAAMTAFAASARRLPAGRIAAHAVVAAARVLDGALTRSEESAALAGWASGALDGLAEAQDVDRSFDALLASGMLALARTGLVAPRADLRARLEALGDRRAGCVALWADACDVFADDEYRRRALDARLPARPVDRVFALLRRHQLTGDARWVADALGVVERAATTGAATADLPLLVAELTAPERAIAPPFHSPSVPGHLPASANASPPRGLHDIDFGV